MDGHEVIMKRIITCLAALSLSCANGGDPYTNDAVPDAQADVVADAAQDQEIKEAGVGSDATIPDGGFDFESTNNAPMLYNGGKVVTKPVNVYIIWYGDWRGSATVAIVEDLIKGFNESAYYNMNASYYQIDVDAGDGGTTYATNKINSVNSIYDSYSRGKSLVEGDVLGIVTDALTANNFPTDENGMYLVLTSKDVIEGTFIVGFCTAYCGWHNRSTITNTDIKYTFVGDPERCPDACSMKSTYSYYGMDHSPNNDWSADGMASIIAHEMSEIASDPDLNAWTDPDGLENGDKCAWTFGPVYRTDAGSAANVTIGQRDFLLQQIFKLNADDGGADSASPIPGLTNGSCALK